MKGAMADPPVNTIKTPKIIKMMISGSNQYFFRTFKNDQRSRKNSISFI